MPDVPPKRPSSIMSDAKRSTIGAIHRRTPSAYPVEVDPETTPPPQAPPGATSLEELSSTVQELARGLERVWPARHEGDRIERMDAKLDRLHADVAELGALMREFIMPGLKATMGNVDLLLSHYEANKIRQALFFDREWPATVKTIDTMGERLSRLERTVERSIDQHESTSNRVEEVGRRAHSNSERLKAIETREAVATGVATAMTTKQKAAYGSAVGALGALVAWLVQQLT